MDITTSQVREKSILDYVPSLGSRIEADVIDLFIVYLVSKGIPSFTGISFSDAFLFFTLLYHTIMGSYLCRGTTIGKWIAKIRIIDTEGYSLSLIKSFARALLVWGVLIIFFLIVAFP